MIQGIRVGPARWSGFDLPEKGRNAKHDLASTIPQGRSSFHHLFFPIRHDLAKFYWDEVPYWGGISPMSLDLSEWLELLDDETFVPPDTLLPRFIDHLCEDWCDFCGFDHRPTVAAEQYVIRDREPIVARPEVTIAFMNIDSAFWIMHARDTELLARVESYIMRTDGFWCVAETPIEEMP